ncbi:MAG: type I secretion system permease/ATPase [Pseudomonadota bacterium]
MGTTEQKTVKDGTYATALRALRPALVVAALFSAVINVLMLTGSIYMLQVYDRVLGSGSVPTLVGLFTIVAALYAFLAYYDYLRSRLLGRAAMRLDRLVSGHAFRSWLRDGHGMDSKAGDSQHLRDLETVRSFMASPAIHGVFDLPWMPLYLAVLFIIHAWLGWLTIAGALVVLALALVNRVVTHGAIARAAALDATERRFAERCRELSLGLLPMGMEDSLARRWDRLHVASLAGTQRGSDPSEALAATSRSFRMLLQSGILTMGAYLVLGGEISAGMIIASSILSGRALAPLDQVIGQWRSIGRASEAHRRLKAMPDAEAAVADRIDLPRPTGLIAVNRLGKYGSARAIGGERARILNNVSFTLQPGDALGVIGNSAAGKSTLARLLVGAWTADTGDIRFDGATLDQWDPKRLGEAIGYLPQQVELLPGTVRDNIARFDVEAEDAEVMEAARLAGVHDMILSLPDGYATRVGDFSTPLSGGQIQRLGLARALFRKPAILVLDEPNSNLDATGDAALTRAIATMREAGSTVVVMAHRPSALAAVNKVMILQAGNVVSFGEKDAVLGGAIAEAAPRPAIANDRDDDAAEDRALPAASGPAPGLRLVATARGGLRPATAWRAR